MISLFLIPPKFLSQAFGTVKPFCMENSSYIIKVAFVDDHPGVCEGIGEIINNFKGMRLWGKNLTCGYFLLHHMVQTGEIPDIIVIDAYLKGYDAEDTVSSLHRHHPSIKFIVYSAGMDLETASRMKEAGCCAYVNKVSPNSELELAINQVFYYGTYENDRFLECARKRKDDSPLTDMEKQFIQLYSKGLSDKQIADKMHLSYSSMERYKYKIFEKFNVLTRQEMLIEAIKRGIVTVDKRTI